MHREQRVVVVFRARHLEQFLSVAQTVVNFDERIDDGFQTAALTTQFLGALAVVPDGRVFEQAAYFFKAMLLVGKVKDTP
jgi:hypothetical protein